VADKRYTIDTFDVLWKDAFKEPTQLSSPKHPDGIDLDSTNGSKVFCVVKLPYPALRIGAYVIQCKTCGIRTGCTTAGRSDDPREIKIPCNTRRGQGTMQ
jgi:hypothetical protein